MLTKTHNYAYSGIGICESFNPEALSFEIMIRNSKGFELIITP